MGIFKKKAEQKPDAAPSPPDKKQDGLITTGVDDLIDLLGQYPKLSVEEAGKRLKVGKAVLRSWIDFLVEEKILGIEYSFTTPYIYLNKPKEEQKTKKVVDNTGSYESFKKDFIERAKTNKIPEDKIPAYWTQHLKTRLESNREFFLRESTKRHLPHAEKLWQKYVEEVISI